MSNPDDLKRKKIVFEGYEKQYADMRIRLTYDGLTQGQFFRGIMLGYTSADPDIVSFVEELKEKIKDPFEYINTRNNVLLKKQINEIEKLINEL